MQRAFDSNSSLGINILVTPLIFRANSSRISHKEWFDAKATQTLKFHTLCELSCQVRLNETFLLNNRQEEWEFWPSAKNGTPQKKTLLLRKPYEKQK